MTTETEAQVTLAPCPFCGGPARAWDSARAAQVWCQNSVSCGGMIQLHEPNLDAITAWNQRTSPAPSSAAPERDGYWGPDVDGDYIVTELRDASLYFAVVDREKARGIVAAIRALTTPPEATAEASALAHLESEARRFAGFYPEGSDGRNTFEIFANKIAALRTTGEAQPETQAVELLRGWPLADRSGGGGPHLDKTNATASQLADWADDAATNLESGWKHVDIFSGFLGGWEQAFLRHVAKEFRAIDTFIASQEPSQ